MECPRCKKKYQKVKGSVVFLCECGLTRAEPAEQVIAELEAEIARLQDKLVRYGRY